MGKATVALFTLLVIVVVGGLILLDIFGLSKIFGPETENLITVKYVFASVLILIVFFVLQMVKMPDNFFFRLILAVGAGVLATAFITPNELYGVIQGNITVFLAVIAAIIIGTVVYWYQKILGPKF